MAIVAPTASYPSPAGSTASRRHHKKPYKSWLKDGVNGGPCSMQIVVQWLSVNYATKWRDDSDNRMPKKLLLQEILDLMQKAGIHHRLAKDVASKISTLQSNYRIAREWYDVIGSQWRKAGAQEMDVKKEVLRRFPYWDELHGAFGSTTTVTTTTTTTTTIAGSISSTSTMTTMTRHNNNDIAGWPMSIRSIIHDDEPASPSPSSWFSDPEEAVSRVQQEQQAVATATVAAATAQATATNATATTACVISLSEKSQAVIVSTATTTTDDDIPPIFAAAAGTNDTDRTGVCKRLLDGNEHEHEPFLADEKTRRVRTKS
ncbi:hypothetical protein BX666DRAFT_2024812 [Dichotomocladium elegans]|nr:hypothetical protein BX666DRAFT_2024812 [Dichotomocladium elegans]